MQASITHRNIRSWLASAIVALAALSFPSSAAAQAEAPAPAAPAPADDATAAGAELFSAILVDSGATDMLFGAVRSEMLPNLRTDLLNSAAYRAASPSRQRALETFIDTVPDILQREFSTEIGEMARRSAPRMAALMNAQQMRDIAAFMRSAELRPLWTELMADVVDPKLEAADFPDWSDHPQLSAFDETDAGRAFAVHRDAIGDILDDELQQGLTRVEPRMRAAIMAGICDALAEDCPAQLRDALGRI
jgi:hypothetical protein